MVSYERGTPVGSEVRVLTRTSLMRSRPPYPFCGGWGWGRWLEKHRRSISGEGVTQPLWGWLGRYGTNKVIRRIEEVGAEDLGGW